MSSFGIASSLSFDAIKFMGNNLCSIKNYSSIIKILVSIVLIHQILDYNSYGKKHTKWVVMGIYIAVLVIYLGIEALIKPTENYLINNCENK
jgi:energy-converting hydrogenase Eha subunit B